MNWGAFESSHGLGFSGIGVISQDLLGLDERISFQGGFGFSVKHESFGKRRANSVVGGRAGIQISW
jgi:hypothetical protein